MRLAMLATILLAASASAQTVTLPEKIDGKSGAWIVIVPLKVDGGQPKWRASAGLTEVPLDALFGPEVAKAIKGKVYTAAAAGRYTVEAWNAKADKVSDIATCVIVIDGAQPMPPGPPIPPPNPNDPLTIKFQAAYSADAGSPADKASWLQAMQGVYGAMPQHIDKQKAGAVVADLVRDYQAAVALVLPDRKQLEGVRRAIAAELAAKLGDDGDQPLDGPTKDKAKAVFASISNALKGVR